MIFYEKDTYGGVNENSLKINARFILFDLTV